MRIAIVCSDLGVPVYGHKGASIHLRELAQALHDAGHDVLVAAARLGGTRPGRFEPAVVEVAPGERDDAVVALLERDPAGGRTVAREVRALLQASSSRAALADTLARFEPDTIYERYGLFCTAGRDTARDLGVPWLLEVNAPLADEQAAHRGLAFEATAHTLERELVTSAAGIVAVSTALGEWVVSLGVPNGRVHVLANGVRPERFYLAPDARARARDELGLDGAPAVGFVGTLKPWHDVASLIRAVAALARSGMRVRLVVVGDGPERPRLQALARSEGIDASTRFVGTVAHESVPAYLGAVDVAAVPYASGDGFYFSPLKLFECLAAALPTVAADVGDLRHCIVPGRTGLLYEPGDVRALAEALLDLLLDPDARRLGEGGRDHVLAHHTWNATAEAVVAIARDAAPAERRLVCA